MVNNQKKYVQKSYSILLSYGANVNCQNKKGQTPLFQASMARSLPNVIELLYKGHADANIESYNGKTALSKARSYETTMTLIDHDADTTSHFITKNGKLMSNLENTIKRKLTSSSKAFLNQSMSEVNEELLVLDFEHFGPPNTTGKLEYHYRRECI